LGSLYANPFINILFRRACIVGHIGPNAVVMAKLPRGTISVIFVAQRTDADAVGYAHAAAMMETLAAQQEGYIAMDSVRGSDGLGITVSYWTDEASAKAWRDHPDHAEIRDAGRDRWYSDYSLHVAQVIRSYDWKKP
jgi:heme-degrading monooxygenase HmoA